MFALQLLCWLIGSLIVMSFLEHFIHKYLMHRRSLPKWVYKQVSVLEKIVDQHARKHHRVYYRIFNYEPDPVGRRTDLGLSIPLGFFGSLFVSIPLACLGFVAGAVIFSAVVVLHHVIWNAIHDEMHNPAGRWFSRLAPYCYLACYHEQHHFHTGKNFNVVLPFADFVLGAWMKPSARDLRRMAKLGYLPENPAAAA